MAVGSMVALCGYVMILASKSSNVRYGGTFLIATGVFPGSAMIMVSHKVLRCLSEHATDETRAGYPTIWLLTMFVLPELGC